MKDEPSPKRDASSRAESANNLIEQRTKAMSLERDASGQAESDKAESDEPVAHIFGPLVSEYRNYETGRRTVEVRHKDGNVWRVSWEEHPPRKVKPTPRKKPIRRKKPASKKTSASGKKPTSGKAPATKKTPDSKKSPMKSNEGSDNEPDIGNQR